MRPEPMAAVLLGAMPLAHAQDYGTWHGMMDHWAWSGGWGLGMIGMLLGWVLVILGIVLLAKWIFGGRRGGGEGASSGRSLEILKERYARGEIGKEEYEQKRRDIAE